MGIVDFYHRYNEDGSFETICTRCFATVGRASERAQLALIEAGHLCPAQAKAFADRSSAEGSSDPRPRRFPGPEKVDVVQMLLLLFAGVLCLYLFPSVIEVELMRHVGPWIACIVLGDLAGCSFLSFVCGLKKTGMLLYLFLTGCESWLYAVHILPRSLLPWVVDIAPTLLVAILIVASSLRSAQAEA